jgi:hypothetical protein
MMSDEMHFTSAHVTSIAARAAELERSGEERQDPDALMRAARLYTLAVHIADDIDGREALPFLQSDLARERDELRTLATDAAANSMLGDRGLASRGTIDSSGTITRMFREIAACIEQRLAHSSVASRHW